MSQFTLRDKFVINVVTGMFAGRAKKGGLKDVRRTAISLHKSPGLVVDIYSVRMLIADVFDIK